MMCQAADSLLALRQPPPDKPSNCCCVSLDVPQSEGLAGEGWAEWFPGYDQPECVPEATVVPTALLPPRVTLAGRDNSVRRELVSGGLAALQSPQGQGPSPPALLRGARGLAAVWPCFDCCARCDHEDVG